MEQPVLSIVVGTYNRLDQLRQCLTSIREQTTVPYIVHVTDAGSTDGTVEMLQSLGDARVRATLVGERLGQARAYNDIFKIVDTPFVGWISDDNVIVDRGLDKAVETLQAYPSIGMYALKVQDKIGPFTKAPYIGGFSTLGILNVNQGVLPTEVLKQVGGFGEDFRDYGIDPDLTAKVLFSGKDVVYGRDIAIHHLRNWSMDPDSIEYKNLREKQARGTALYEAKYGNLLPTSRLFELKKRVWKRAQDMFGARLSVNSASPVMGMLPRDLYNICNGRFISILDPLANASRPYHLRQRLPSSTIRRGNVAEVHSPRL